MDQTKLNRKSLVWLLPVLLSLLYPPMQSQSYIGGTGSGELAGAVGGRQFDGWGPCWHLFEFDFDHLDSILDVGYFIEGDHAIEWGVLVWEWLVLLVLVMIYHALRSNPAPTQ